MKRVFIILGIVLVMVLSSCKARVTSDSASVKRYEDNITYFQDQNTGAVFALVVIKTGVSMSEEGVGIAYIPKSDLTPEIIAQIKNYKE